MKVDTINLNVIETLKKRIIQLEERCLGDIGHKNLPKSYRFISINENDIWLDFDVQCEVSDTEGKELIPKIEDYTVPAIDLSNGGPEISDFSMISII